MTRTEPVDRTTLVEILRTDGSREHHYVNRHIAIEWSRGTIGAEVLDTVNLRDGRVMLVDDDGYEAKAVEVSPGHTELRPVRARKPVNAEATKLYHRICKPGTTHQIVGDVALVIDEEIPL